MEAIVSAIFGFWVKLFANGVSARLGAIALTRTLGASSAARLRVNPSTAALAVPIAE
jgi:hypothetical protein